MSRLRDVAQLALRRPVDRGFVVNTQLQRDIWERVFKHLLKVSERAKRVPGPTQVSLPCSPPGDAPPTPRSTRPSATSSSQSRCLTCLR